MPCRLLLPAGYDSSKQYPLVLFLHGAGERGSDNERQLTFGGKLFLRDSIREDFPAIVVFPQCPFSSFWSNVQLGFDVVAKHPVFNFQTGGAPTRALELLMAMVKELMEELPIKKDQVYLGGLSMGAMGAFELVHRMPGTFAAAFTICGGAHPATAHDLRQTAWWVFHGKKDPLVPMKLSEEIVEALRVAGADVKFTVYPDDFHNSWNNAFNEPGLMEWLFSQTLR